MLLDEAKGNHGSRAAALIGQGGGGLVQCAGSAVGVGVGVGVRVGVGVGVRVGTGVGVVPHVPTVPCAKRKNSALPQP